MFYVALLVIIVVYAVTISYRAASAGTIGTLALVSLLVSIALAPLLFRFAFSKREAEKEPPPLH